MRARLNILVFSSCIICGIAGTSVVVCLAEDSAKAPAKQAAPPVPPIPQAPIEFFRVLLTLSPEERLKLMDERSVSADQKRILLTKVKEYEAMTPAQRELRLGVTELRWYLVPLMRTALNDRRERLEKIPEEKRKLVEERLRHWDELSAPQQKEFLENEMAVQYFLRLQSSTLAEKEIFLETIPAQRREKLEADLARWLALPTEKRDRMCEGFQKFFDLNADEKEKTLGKLPEAERAQMETTLKTFQALPAIQRKQCIESFGKISNMTRSERNQFLKKAELWQEMTPAERKSWRELVHKLPEMPPLPPGMKFPPLPPNPLTATNSPR